MSEVVKKKSDNQEDLKSYFKGVKSEWGKVTWPEKKQILSETVIVILVCFFFTALVYIIDILYGGIFEFIGKTF